MPNDGKTLRLTSSSGRLLIQIQESIAANFTAPAEAGKKVYVTPKNILIQAIQVNADQSNTVLFESDTLPHGARMSIKLPGETSLLRCRQENGI